MNDLFMCLLLNLKNHGDITSASMNDHFINVSFDDDENEYSLIISKEKKENENNA